MELELPIFETREVLIEHLKAKIGHICKDLKVSIEEISNEICKDLSNNEIISLLQNDQHLEKISNDIILRKTINKESIGEEIFKIIAKTESHLCAQITGMLLELDIETLSNLLINKNEFEKAVKKAKTKYLQFILSKYKSDKLYKSREEIGEVLFDLVSEYYPEPQLASRLTGMLLELELSILNDLIYNSHELENKLNIAFNALKSANL